MKCRACGTTKEGGAGGGGWSLHGDTLRPGKYVLCSEACRDNFKEKTENIKAANVPEEKPKEGEGTRVCRACSKPISDGKEFCGGICVDTYYAKKEGSEGKKDDKDKLRVCLVPPHALEEVAKVFEWGASHYGVNNWATKPLKWMRFLNAIRRHLLAFLKGEDNDKQTGLSHLAHLACTAMILLEYIRFKRIGRQGCGDLDDRFNWGKEGIQ